MFDAVVCWVGRDHAYGAAAVTILRQLQIPIVAIAGESAAAVWDRVAVDLKDASVAIVNVKRPWLDTRFHDCLRPGVLGINGGFDYLIPASVLDLCPTINLHPAALPRNRGCHHSFWGILERTPLGATMHWMTAELDGGPILAQATFADDGWMTAGEIQQRSNRLCLQLLQDHLGAVMRGESTCTPQGEGSYHAKHAIVDALTLHDGETITVERLFDLCRATCTGQHGFIVAHQGRRILVQIAGLRDVT